MANGSSILNFEPHGNVRRIAERFNAGDFEGAQQVLDLIIDACRASRSPAGEPAALPEPAFWIAEEPKRHGMHPAYRSAQARTKYGGEGVWVGYFSADQMRRAATPSPAVSPPDPAIETLFAVAAYLGVNADEEQARPGYDPRGPASKTLIAAIERRIEGHQTESAGKGVQPPSPAVPAPEPVGEALTEREAFEAWFLDYCGTGPQDAVFDQPSTRWLDRRPDGEYEETRVRDAWTGWIGRSARAALRALPVPPDLNTRTNGDAHVL